jgi:hypothetical protein
LEVALFYAAERLGPIRDEVVFVGGAVRGLLVTDPGAAGVRPTDDVDVIVEVSSLAAYQKLEARLRRQGFKHDPREDAPICRFVNGSTTLDVMPTAAGVLGFSNPWYAHAFVTSTEHRLRGPGTAEQRIRVVTATSFVATKLVSYESRGGKDPYHHDLEDIVAVVDGRPSLTREMQSEPRELRVFVAKGIDALFAAGLDEHAAFHLPSDSASQARLPLVLERFRELTRLAGRARRPS